MGALAEAIHLMLYDFEFRARLSANAKGMTDGQGAQRTIAIMQEAGS